MIAALALAAALPAAPAGDCSHPKDPAFYDQNNYAIRKIEFRSPFTFFFLVRQRFNAIKESLPVKEGGPFRDDDYDNSFNIVRDAVKADSALGKDSPVKIVTTTATLENCQEEPSGPHTVDIVYRIFSTDPIPAIQASPEKKQAAVNRPATMAGEQTTIPNYRLNPHFGYDHTRRGYGGLDLSLRIPTVFLDSFELSAAGSSSSREIHGELHGSGNPGVPALEHVEYALAYAFTDAPALGLQLTKGIVNGQILGSSKQLKTASAQVAFRYGASVEQGIQQTNLPGASSRFGALKFLGGVTSTTQYSELAASYGFAAGGSGLSNLDYARHIGDAVYSARFPGHKNVPWDVAVRATAGGITGGPILVIDRFFGGNSVSPFIAGTTWNIPTGPLIRSIPTNRVAGLGLGGTSFFSTNLTVGKVIKGWPLIPAEIENSPGFGDAVNSAENTAETWFMDDYESASPAFQKLLDDFPPKLKADVDAAKAVMTAIRAATPVSKPLSVQLKSSDHLITVSRIMVQTASDTTLRSADRAGRLRAWLTPASALVKLASLMETLEPLAPASATQLRAVKASIDSDLAGLAAGLKQIQNSPEHKAAATRAKQDMARPREIIDTLRFETNRYAVSLVGIADVGRLWPDPYGNRYAFGGGGRFSVVTVNFTIGYAVNPHPRPEIGQGRGALFFSISYTNLFR